MNKIHCNFCNNDFPISSNCCPHCAQPGLFPNVIVAGDSEEVSELDKRYQNAYKETKLRQCDHILSDYEKTILENSKAVISRSLSEVERLAKSDNEIYVSYYKLIEADLKLPSGSKWDIFRRLAEESLFPGYRERIRFGSLSFTKEGSKNYGECSFVLRNKMIAPRASVFEENCVIFMKRHRLLFDELDDLPKGYRATWNDRGKLAAVKAAGDIKPETDPDEYQEILLHNAPDSKDDVFVEVHVYGPITVRTMEHVTVTNPKRRQDKIFLKSLENKLKKFSVKLEFS